MMGELDNDGVLDIVFKTKPTSTRGYEEVAGLHRDLNSMLQVIQAYQGDSERNKEAEKGDHSVWLLRSKSP